MLPTVVSKGLPLMRGRTARSVRRHETSAITNHRTSRRPRSATLLLLLRAGDRPKQQRRPAAAGATNRKRAPPATGCPDRSGAASSLARPAVGRPEIAGYRPLVDRV